MKTREEKALEIAKLENPNEDFKFDYCLFCGAEIGIHKAHTFECPKNGIEETRDGYPQRYEETKFESKANFYIDKYSSFNGLMEIVERVNISTDKYWFEISRFSVTVETDITVKYYDYNDDNSLIDALQDAVLFYLTEVQNERD